VAAPQVLRAGHDEHGQEARWWFRVSTRPAGAYVIKDGRVRWRPAVDGDCLFAIMVAVAYLFARAGGTR